jgi:AcrR family transcriptional regulator
LNVTDTTSHSPALSGRRREAARNDQRILEAARDVFVADPSAPISDVAKRAGVGISALYSRYDGKEDLLRQLCGDGLRRLGLIAEAGLADERDHWTVFAEFMRQAVEADTSSLTQSLAGKFTPTEELETLTTESNEKIGVLFDRVKDALRPGIEVLDLPPIWEQLSAIKFGNSVRSAELRTRYLAITLDGLRGDRTDDLPGSPPTLEEMGARWAPPS